MATGASDDGAETASVPPRPDGLHRARVEGARARRGVDRRPTWPLPRPVPSWSNVAGRTRTCAVPRLLPITTPGHATPDRRRAPLVRLSNTLRQGPVIRNSPDAGLTPNPSHGTRERGTRDVAQRVPPGSAQRRDAAPAVLDPVPSLSDCPRPRLRRSSPRTYLPPGVCHCVPPCLRAFRSQPL